MPNYPLAHSNTKRTASRQKFREVMLRGVRWGVTNCSEEQGEFGRPAGGGGGVEFEL